MLFKNVTIELNGIKEIVFNQTTVWVKAPNESNRWIKYKLPKKVKSEGDIVTKNKETGLLTGMSELDLHDKVIGGMSGQEMHDILEHHMQTPNKYEVATSGQTINVRRKE